MSPPADLVTAVRHALQAPSVHNTQPWRWRLGDDTVQLHADRGRHLVATDPDGRDLVLSCGAALHHLLVALAAQGVEVDVDRLPDPDDSGHLATVTVRAGAGHPADATLFPAIHRRRTDRRRLSHRPVPAAHLEVLIGHAQRAGALLLPVTGPGMRDGLAAALDDAAHRQEPSAGYTVELELWTRRYAGAHDGVPRANIAPAPVGAVRASPLRRFPHGQLAQPRQLPGHGPADDAAELLVLAMPGDTVLDRLMAGEATSAALLAATRLGLATTPLSQGVEVAVTRRAIARDVLHVPEHPQLLLRVGWPASTAAELPATPRRDLHSVLLPD
jgi:nitroreductase